jgi:hypothetical protein
MPRKFLENKISGAPVKAFFIKINKADHKYGKQKKHCPGNHFDFPGTPYYGDTSWRHQV